MNKIISLIASFIIALPVWAEKENKNPELAMFLENFFNDLVTDRETSCYFKDEDKKEDFRIFQNETVPLIKKELGGKIDRQDILWISHDKQEPLPYICLSVKFKRKKGKVVTIQCPSIIKIKGQFKFHSHKGWLIKQ